MAYRHLKKFKIDPILYMTEWFMCIFSRTLPWASVLRVWDMFFCEGTIQIHTVQPFTYIYHIISLVGDDLYWSKKKLDHCFSHRKVLDLFD